MPGKRPRLPKPTELDAAAAEEQQRRLAFWEVWMAERKALIEAQKWSRWRVKGQQGPAPGPLVPTVRVTIKMNTLGFAKQPGLVAADMLRDLADALEAHDAAPMKLGTRKIFDEFNRHCGDFSVKEEMPYGDPAGRVDGRDDPRDVATRLGSERANARWAKRRVDGSESAGRRPGQPMDGNGSGWPSTGG